MLRMVNRLTLCVLVLLTAAVGAMTAQSTADAAKPMAAAKAPVQPRQAFDARAAAKARSPIEYARLPLGFEPNRGQFTDKVKYVSRGPGYTLMLTPADATVVLTHVTPPPEPHFASALKRPDSKALRPRVEEHALRMTLLGVNGAARITGSDKLPGTSNYFIGNDRAKWRSNIPNYAKVNYSSIYPGIDLVYYGRQGRLEYDFVVAPHRDPNAIRFALDGADKVALDAHGDLVMRAGRDRLTLRKPVVYQEVAGRRKKIAGRFKRIDKKTFGFEVARYDRDKPLVIDPDLAYATYVGGFFSMGHGIAVDSSGSVYIVGLSGLCSCYYNPYPTTANSYNDGASQTSFAIVVTKLSPDGSSLVYSTYFGGTAFDAGYGIALDSSNDAYVTGLTISTNFPHANTNVPNGSKLNGFVNAFVTELNPSGSGVVYSTYLGSTNADEAIGIAVDGSGNAYVVGSTYSTDFPTTANAFQQSPPGNEDYAGFLSKLTVTSGTVGLAYSTYVANNTTNSSTLPANGATLWGVAVDASGDAYVSGWAGSGFPTTTGPAFAGSTFDALIARFDTTQSAGASLKYARYLGGSSSEVANAIALVPSCASDCNAYVGGITSSSDFPVTAGAAQTSFGGDGSGISITQESGFLAEVDSAGGLVYATYLGGTGYSQVFGLGVDGAGQVYATGSTNYSDFPTTSAAFQPSFQAPNGQLWTIRASAYPSYPTRTSWNDGSMGLTHLALDPSTSPATIYAAAFRTGIFKSTDGGASFNPTAFNMGGVTSLTINTNTSPHTLYWGTGSAGVFESSDGLSTWSNVAGALPAGTVVSTVVAGGASAPSALYVGTTSTFFRSTDGGATFTQATGLPSVVEVNAIVSDGAGNLFIGTDRGIFKSTDQGATFTATNMNFATVWSLAADTTNHIVFAGYAGGVVSSSDGFNSNFVFASISATLPTVFSVADDPLNPSIVYAGVYDNALDWGAVFRSTDGGRTFPAEDGVFQGAVVPIAIDTTTSPETLYWGAFEDNNAFLTQLSADGKTFLFSTYLGGSNNDYGRGVAVDASGSAYIVGSTQSSDFPATAGAYQTSLGGSSNVGFENLFIVKYPNTLPSSSGSTTAAPSSNTTVAFSGLTSPGTTTVTTSGTAPAPAPGDFTFSGTYYDVTTTATYSGTITVCIDYVVSDYTDPSLLALFHYDTTDSNCASNNNWCNVTTSNDTANGVICGQVSSLSPFAIGAQSAPLSKSNCENGQWRLWNNPSFKNQGQCIKFVNHS